ncbi:MAG TPA: PIN domain-containing protein, partial [Candidatus Binatia bacterium]|nr:PIN domain-containing protein [Candidatus Binatia bacterium]
MDPKKLFLLDTSALLTLRSDEPGAERVVDLLSRAKRGSCQLFASFMTRMELLYLIRREEGEEPAREALRLVDSFTIEWITCEPSLLEVAARLKARGGLSVADSWIGATAVSRQAVLIHNDPEFTKFSEIAQESLRK